mmetsp:Transcript_4895/g.13866  ORF Transcript_4895/g.13866 Transcript_4895/m.13866 type:complete len:705 (+) Transcript_4895:149-2263(+)
MALYIYIYIYISLVMSGNDTSSSEEVPYHLMPVAAVCATYTLVATIRALYQIYANVRHDPAKVTTEMKLKGQLPKPLKSRQFILLVASIVTSVLAYGYVTAIVDNAIAESDHFDPYDILEVSTAAALDEIKQAYRALSKTHHPDKGGDADLFYKINLAYRALSDETSRENFEKYGHPDGPQTRTLSFAMPDWLLHPTGGVAAILVVVYLGLFVGIIVWVVRFMTQSEKKALENTVASGDAAYIASSLSPTSTHLDVLFCLATAPENLSTSQADIDRADKIRAERMELLDKEKKAAAKTGGDFDDLMDGDWADDNDEEEDEETKRRAELGRKAEEEKAKHAKSLAAATGKIANVKLEGLDDGVLGQMWVEDTLKKAGKWPPELGILAGKTFKNEKGKMVAPLDNRAVRRNLCMTMGRLNSIMLNTHPDLLAAGAKGLIDATYFKSTMEFRARTGLLLEAALRVAMSARSYRLAKTVVETVSMFKVGTMTHDEKKTVDWFNSTMRKQYGDDGIPCLEIVSKDIETPDEDEIATGDSCALLIEVKRPHADAFTKQKIEMCKKQGIPPEIGMQAYREGWWVLIRAKKISGGGGADASNQGIDSKSPIAQLLDDAARKRFAQEKGENRLQHSWPFIISNCAQKQGKVKIQFKAPSTPGKYNFFVSVKSQEFLGADHDFVIEKEVVDGEELARKQEEEDDAEEDEPKKMK